MRLIERNARQRRRHLHAAKARLSRFLFATQKQCAAYTFARKCRMSEECANARRVACRIEQRVLAGMVEMACTVKSAAFAPSAAACKLSANLSGILRAVINQLHVHAKDGLHRSLNLFRRIPPRLQLAHRALDQLAQPRHVIHCSSAYEDRSHHRPTLSQIGTKCVHRLRSGQAHAPRAACPDRSG